MKLRRLAFGFVVAAAWLSCPATPVWAYTYDFGPWTSSNGSDATVYDWDWDTSGPNSCDQTHVPDGPAKPFRDSQNRIQILLPGENRRMLGTSFSNLVPEQLFPGGRPCATNITHESATHVPGEPPDKYHGHEWITTPFRTPDGNTVHVLTHNEYHGAGDPLVAGGPIGPACKTPLPANGSDAQLCWLGSTTFAQSTDDGATYTHAAPPGHFQVSIPYQYTPDWGRHGLVSTANLILNPFDDYFYTILNAENQFSPTTKSKGRNLLQKEGGCIVRSPSLPSTGWAGWQGYTGFSASFPNPYPTEPANKSASVCESVTDHLQRSAGSDAFTPGGFVGRGLSYDEYLQRFVLIGTAVGSKGAWYSLSPDLVNWSDKQLLVQPSATGGCGSAMSYPTISDPSDLTLNFERPGRTPDVFYSCNGGSGSWDRNLVRVPIKFGYRSATFEDGAIIHPTTGFDSVDPGGSLTLSSAEKYEGAKSVRAEQADALSRGALNVSWRNGSDVWYGTAFKLPVGFAPNNDRVGLLKWENASGSRTGGVVYQTDNTVAVERGGTPIDSGRFSLPEGRWFWLEVHQRLDQSRPLSEAFVDGKLVWTSTAPNNYPDSDGVPTKVNFGLASGPPGAGSFLYMDRATVSESQRGALSTVPAAPTQWSVKGQGGLTSIQWQPVSGATGYRLYRRVPSNSAPNVPWQLLADTTALSATDNGLANNQTYQYRLVAYNSAGDSMFSAPKQAIPGGRVTVTVDVVDTNGNEYDASGGEVTDPQDFQLLASANSGLPSGFFTLDDDPSSSTPVSQTGTIWVNPGPNYWAGILVPPGWQYLDNKCDNGSTASNITVYAGETVNCWFVLKKSP